MSLQLHFEMIMRASCFRRKCQNDPDSFCYICGSYWTAKQRLPINYFIKKAYLAYFEVKSGVQDKMPLSKVCGATVATMRKWSNGQKYCMKFGVPVV